VTEAEWLACTRDDTVDMQACLRGKGSPRKLRLFACACCRHIDHLLGDLRSKPAVEVAERYADGLASDAELQAAWLVAASAADDAQEALREGAIEQPYLAAMAGHWPADSGHSRSGGVILASHAAFFAQQAADPVVERRWQAKVLCDIFGEPHLPLPIPTGWLTSTVRGLATAIYAERAFDRLPILADALEDAGCDNADVLAHCRGDGPHVRGCWVVDLILGKT
jgi:hypothetical protein